jgi:DNA-binding MarR family transcriptional regulator
VTAVEDERPLDDGHPVGKPRLRIVDESPRFAQLWESVLFDDELTSNAKVIYAILQRMSHEFPDGLFPSHEEIARRANIKDRETVSACLKQLEARGHIRREPRGRRESALIILVQPEPRDVEKTRISDSEKTRISDVEKTRTNKRDNVRENVTPPSSPPQKPKRRSSKRTALPPDWWPDDDLSRWALDRGWSEAKLALEVEKFRVYHIDNKQTLAASWPGCWRTWVLNEIGWSTARDEKGKKLNPNSAAWSRATGKAVV